MFFVRLLLVFICFSLPLSAKDEEIVVRLASKANLLPIYVSPIQGDNIDFPHEYLSSLRNIFLFDVNHNGQTKVMHLPDDKKYGFVQEEQKYDAPCDFAHWKDANIFYLLKMKMEGKNLSVKVLSINGQSTKLIDGISFTGELDKDRRKIHHIADTVHQLLFQTKGIASQRFVFCVKKKLCKGNEVKWLSELYEADYDGANLRKLPQEGIFCVTPMYVPVTMNKGPKILYISYKIGQPKIFCTSLKDGKSIRLTSIRGNQLTPAISQDAMQLAFCCDATGRTDLFLMKFHPDSGALGKPRQIFTAKGSTQASPTFSPDGKKIAFVSNKDGAPKIYILTIPQENVKIQNVRCELISKRTREASAPVWSPDGKKIAYSGKSQGSRQIWVYDFETGEEQELTTGKQDKENPTWAPNSLHLIFNTSNDDNSELYLINLHQTDAVKIDTIPGEKRFPSFAP